MPVIDQCYLLVTLALVHFCCSWVSYRAQGTLAWSEMNNFKNFHGIESPQKFCILTLLYVCTNGFHNKGFSADGPSVCLAGKMAHYNTATSRSQMPIAGILLYHNLLCLHIVIQLTSWYSGRSGEVVDWSAVVVAQTEVDTSTDWQVHIYLYYHGCGTHTR